MPPISPPWAVRIRTSAGWQDLAVAGAAGADGTASVPRTVTGIIPAAGTTATAGTGFTYTHTAASGIYVFTFAVAFPAVPVILATANGTDAVWPIVTAVSASGFTVEMTNGSNARADRPFFFLAHRVA
jgi:hypothetical protein